MQSGLFGIDIFRSLDQLFVDEYRDGSGCFLQTNKKFTIKNGTGQEVFKAIEGNSSFRRRTFNINVLDVHGREVICLNGRQFRIPTLEVKLPNDQIIGYVKSNFAFCTPKMTLKNAQHEKLLRIKGPNKMFPIGADIDFDIIALNGTKIGKITRHWSGWKREFFSTFNHFSINFPMDLDVYTKAMLLGTCMFIDLVYCTKEDSDSD